MRVGRLAAGVVCLGLAGFFGWWSGTHRDYYDKVSRPGRQSITAADLAARGPGDRHAVLLTDVEMGEPIIVGQGNNGYLDVWFPVFPAPPEQPPGRGRRPAKAAPKDAPRIFVRVTDSLPSKSDSDGYRHRSEVIGTVINGLPGQDAQLPPEVAAAYPKAGAATVWHVRAEGVWKERAVFWAAAATAAFAVLGLWLGATGLTGRPAGNRVRDTRRLPAVRPLDARTVRKASRAYYHAKCGSNTLCTGDDLVRLECPFRGCSGTFCCVCNEKVPLSAVQWEDTGENVAEYRQRIAGSVPLWRRVWLFWLGNAYQGAVNLGLDEAGRVVQPLREPPGGRVPVGAPAGPARSRGCPASAVPPGASPFSGPAQRHSRSRLHRP
jgi:hypothetical protein